MRGKCLFTVLALPAVALALALTGCVDERIVYQDREMFATPPTGAAGFLGYSKAEDNLTTCGNCHVGQQAKWHGTAHASAFAGVKNTAGAPALCEGCHTVSPLGNVAEGSGGFPATKDARYQDVQCESCHGPGLAHVQNPSKATIGTVLAPMGVGGTALNAGCAECHAGAHLPYAEEWAASAHGGGNQYLASGAGGRDACKECHTAEDALLKFGVNANYLEKATHLPSLTANMSITCAVCHDPHGAQHAGQLRYAVTEPSLDKNLCMKCHYKRGVPDPTTFRGPHSPEGPVLLGEGGWWPPILKAQVPLGKIETTHGSTSSNPKLCAGCHINQFEYTLPDGKKALSSGHTFEAIPCVDANGKPIVKGTCAPAQRTFKTCTGAGCHGSENVARSAVATVEMRITNLNDQLNQVLMQINSNWRTCRNNNSCAPFRGAPSPFNFIAGQYTVAQGAAFNYDMGLRRSAAIHNPFLVEALLITSIQQVRQEYNLTGALTVDLTPQIRQH
jgi:predicted CXXCH cytochrome family protein